MKSACPRTGVILVSGVMEPAGYHLPRGVFQYRGSTVNPGAIRKTALLTVEGELDDISGSGQTEAAHKLCTNIIRHDSHHLEVKGAGHYGIFSGRRWREVVYPHVRDFILKHPDGAVSATRKKVKATAKTAAKKAVARPTATKRTAARKATTATRARSATRTARRA